VVPESKQENMMAEKSHKITAPIEIPEQRMKDLLCNAFEGGSNYWYQIKEFCNPDNVKVEYKHLDIPFLENGHLIVGDMEEDQPDAKLDLQTMINGLKIMAEKYPWHFNNFMGEMDDAETGDVFLQCSLWGDIIFG
jgi:hypothetical protein